MNLKLMIGLAASLVLSGCGGSGSYQTAAMSPQPQVLDTQAVLAIARVPSETSDPMPVSDGALMLADANDEASDPVSVT
jgi:septal ring-binding cell division protein DamX